MVIEEFLGTLTAFPSIQKDADPSAAYLTALVEYSPIAIILLDARHRYSMCNSAFEKLFQYSRTELSNANLDDLIADPDMAEDAACLTHLVLQGNKVHKVAQRRRRDGMMVDVEIYGIPLIVGGELAGVYGLYQDVTERKRTRTTLRQISDQLENVQQEERRRIARDLHDSTSQELAVLNWNLTRLKTRLSDGDEDLKRLVDQTSEIALQCSASIRSASYLLHPPLLGEAGLTQALPWLTEGFEQRSGVRVALELSSGLGRFPNDVEAAIFRIVQEGLANVLRHSGSPVVQISLVTHENWLQLSVSDQGKGNSSRGIKARSTGNGVGISGMRERVEQLGGYLNIDCNGEGTSILATLPSGTRLDA